MTRNFWLAISTISIVHMRTWSVFDISSVEVRDGLISFKVTGEHAYAKFMHESGGIRWQRLPPTESKGRYHTSTITVAVFRDEHRSDIIILDKDLEWQYCRGSGKGGQNRNKRDTAVWLKHIPSGIRIRSEEERTQHLNKGIALKRLKIQLDSVRKSNVIADDNKSRKQQTGEGNRSIYLRTVRERDNLVINHSNGKKITFKKYKKGDLRSLLE